MCTAELKAPTFNPRVGGPHGSFKTWKKPTMVLGCSPSRSLFLRWGGLRASRPVNTHAFSKRKPALIARSPVPESPLTSHLKSIRHHCPLYEHQHKEQEAESLLNAGFLLFSFFGLGQGGGGVS